MPVAQPQKKILLDRIIFSLLVYICTLVYIEWDNIILEKTNVILKKNECKKKLYFRVQQKNNETFRKFSQNQEVAAMQVELLICLKSRIFFSKKSPLSTYISNNASRWNNYETLKQKTTQWVEFLNLKVWMKKTRWKIWIYINEKSNKF